MAGGSLISRLYDFLDGMTIHDLHLDGEFDVIHAAINGGLGDANLAADADIQGTKIKIGTIPINRLLEAVATTSYVSQQISAAVQGTLPQWESNKATSSDGVHWIIRKDGQPVHRVVVLSDNSLQFQTNNGGTWQPLLTISPSGSQGLNSALTWALQY